MDEGLAIMQKVNYGSLQMNNNKSIEDSLIEYYSDFQEISDLQDNYTGFINLPDRNQQLCKDIFDIVYTDFMKMAKTDLLHYVLEDVCNILDWDYITGELQEYYFAEKSDD